MQKTIYKRKKRARHMLKRNQLKKRMKRANVMRSSNNDKQSKHAYKATY